VISQTYQVLVNPGTEDGFIKSIIDRGARLIQQLKDNTARQLRAGSSSSASYVAVLVAGLALLVAMLVMNVKWSTLLHAEETGMLAVFLGMPDSLINNFIKNSETFIKTMHNENEYYQEDAPANDRKKDGKSRRKKFYPRGWDWARGAHVLGRYLVLLAYLVTLVLLAHQIKTFKASSMLSLYHNTLNAQTFEKVVTDYQSGLLVGQRLPVAGLSREMVEQLRLSTGQDTSLIVVASPDNQLNTMFADPSGKTIYYLIAQVLDAYETQPSPQLVVARTQPLIRRISAQLSAQSAQIIQAYTASMTSELLALAGVFILGTFLWALCILLYYQYYLGPKLDMLNLAKQALLLIDPAVCREIYEAHLFFDNHK
jgi:hypothetical protein